MTCYVIYTGCSSSGGGGRGSSSHETRLHHRSSFVSNATIGPRQPLGAGAVQLALLTCRSQPWRTLTVLSPCRLLTLWPQPSQRKRGGARKGDKSRTRPVGMRSSRMMGMRIVGMRMVGMRSSSRPRSRMKAPASSRAWRSTTTAGARIAAFSQRTPLGPAQSRLVVASTGVRTPS